MKTFRIGGDGLLLTLTLALLLMLFNPASGAVSKGESQAGKAVYLIQLEGAPLATYRGTVAGLAATNPKVAETRKLDVHSAAAQAYAARLNHQRSYAVSDMESSLGRAVEGVVEYDTAFNGLAARLTPAEAAKVSSIPGVVRVERDREIRIQDAGGPMPLSLSVGGTAEANYGASMPPMVLLFFPSVLLFASVCRAIRRRGKAWRGVAVSAGLLAVTAACGGSGEDRNLEPHSEIEPSPGAAWIGAPGVWSGSENGGLPGTMGEGIVVGILDSGINSNSPSFAAVGGDGYVHKNPRGKYFGVCDPENWEIYNPNFPCNDKLIGAWSFVSDDFNHTEGNPVDFLGHGTHVAATAAGNFVQGAVLHGPSGVNLTRDISGVAPHANIISYRVVGADGFGPVSQILAGMDQAVRDGVDVLNISLGGGLVNPWKDSAFGASLLSAREAGISVAVAAGNSGPDPATVASPGVIPWTTTVAAGTHSTAYVNNLFLAGGPSDPADIEGLGLSAGYGPAPIVYAGDYGDPLCQGDFTDAFDGEIVVCDRGEIHRLKQGKNVKENGGGAMVLAEVEPGGEEALFTDSHFLPAVHIAKTEADRLKGWLASGTDHEAEISGTNIDIDGENADMVAGFSSRGWNDAVRDVVKPDILAPGFAVVAPVVDGIGYAAWQGTSMASPHVAGVFALLKALHPDWSPAEMHSAVMTTAVQGVKTDSEGSPATPFDAGAGRIDASRALRAALVLEETPAGFENADPESYWETTEAGIGNPADLNLASLGEGACVDRCFWTRVVRSVAKETTTWKVTVEADSDLLLTAEPESFSLAPGKSVEISVTADVSEAPLDEWVFGRVLLSELESAAPEAGLPVAVQPASESLPESLEIRTEDASGSKSFFRFEATGITDLNVSPLGLVPAIVVEDVIDSDPSPEDPANMDGGVYLEYVDVPSDAAALFIDLESSNAAYLDVYAGMEGSTAPMAQSLNSGSSESVTVLSPAAGRWWIGVHNAAPDPQADLFTLRYRVITMEDGAAGNLTVNPDRTVGSPFGTTVDWDLPGTVAGDHWYGAIVLGSSPAAPNDIGAIPVKVVVKQGRTQ